MATIAVHEFITLDGVFEEPSWTFEYGFDPKMGETISAITEQSSTILLGRRTYEMFAPAWRDRTVEDDPGAPFFNETEKFVVGAQPLGEEWANTIALGAYDPAAIRRLKRERDGVIYISGSGQLVRALLSEGLVDELHLFVYPVALGEGEKFWSEGDGPTRLVLKAQNVYDNGVVHQSYGPAQDGYTPSGKVDAEIPPTRYGATGGAAEDLYESTAIFFINRPMLKKVAPQREAFLAKIVDRWKPLELTKVLQTAASSSGSGE